MAIKTLKLEVVGQLYDCDGSALQEDAVYFLRTNLSGKPTIEATLTTLTARTSGGGNPIYEPGNPPTAADGYEYLFSYESEDLPSPLTQLGICDLDTDRLIACHGNGDCQCNADQDTIEGDGSASSPFHVPQAKLSAMVATGAVAAILDAVGSGIYESEAAAVLSAPGTETVLKALYFTEPDGQERLAWTGQLAWTSDNGLQGALNNADNEVPGAGQWSVAGGKIRFTGAILWSKATICNLVSDDTEDLDFSDITGTVEPEWSRDENLKQALRALAEALVSVEVFSAFGTNGSIPISRLLAGPEGSTPLVLGGELVYVDLNAYIAAQVGPADPGGGAFDLTGATITYTGPTTDNWTNHLSASVSCNITNGLSWVVIDADTLRITLNTNKNCSGGFANVLQVSSVPDTPFTTGTPQTAQRSPQNGGVAINNVLDVPITAEGVYQIGWKDGNDSVMNITNLNIVMPA